MKNTPSHMELLTDIDSTSNSRELIKVVRSLMRFIVIESKGYVDRDKSQEYIKHYLFALTKATNGVSNYVNMEKVKEQILVDIQESCY